MKRNACIMTHIEHKHTHLEELLGLRTITARQSFVKRHVEWAIHGVQVHAGHFVRVEQRMRVSLREHLGSENGPLHPLHPRGGHSFVQVHIGRLSQPVDRVEVRQVRL